MTKFRIGDKVMDRDGRQGIVKLVTEWRGSIWYDVRFEHGEAVRYASDLILR
ncbi:MAG: hypothetical protein KGL39_06525 [Patescibacteria group bacterium]|nr:hypothetical protein [Patescibacteria group bacterium]